jgi:hypothetical protein
VCAPARLRPRAVAARARRCRPLAGASPVLRRCCSRRRRRRSRCCSPARPPACPLRRASLPRARAPRSPGIEKIKYEGPESNNPLAFKHYDAKAVVHGRTMEDWCRFSVCYWHTFRGLGADPFGGQTLFREWDDGSNSMDNALRRVDAAFEFMTKLGS